MSGTNIVLGSSPTTDLEAVDYCLRANTAGPGYSVGDQVKVTKWFNPSTNTQVAEVAFNMTAGGTPVTTPLTAVNFDECPSAGGASETLVCAAGVTLIRRVDAVTGVVSFIGSNGAVVAAPAAYTIGACQFVGKTVEARLYNVAAGASWTPANIPAGKTLIGLSFTVITGTASVTDAGGTTVSLLPLNYSNSWNADTTGVLTPPTAITAAANSRVVVSMSVR